ncbi:hypothetical protein OG352_15330 [Streptomyces sp. NBC_01485]|uniref:hypothetical protein n=1 Tax=Streptomyces sp. NBC_01485 TaxID=2903884 RepID=UPI002E33EE47|nr:hypothetical protein [Streptomyces sp. NBC_01485]
MALSADPVHDVRHGARHRTAVLLAIYAGCISGQLRDLGQRILARGDLPEV